MPLYFRRKDIKSPILMALMLAKLKKNQGFEAAVVTK